MRHFRASFGPLDPVGFNTLSFEALDLFEALGSLAALNCRSSIQLWCEGRYFGRFERIVEANASYWRLVGDAAAEWLPKTPPSLRWMSEAGERAPTRSSH